MASEWKGAIAFANIGLALNAIEGNRWNSCHKPKLLKQFIALLTYKNFHVIGLCLNEVGDLSHPLRSKDRIEFNGLIQEAFEQANATKHGPASILWSDGETVTAWRNEVNVKTLQKFKNMDKVDPWRSIELFRITSATEHGPCKLLVHNNHQPASGLRPFPANMRIRMCKEVLRNAIRYQHDNFHSIGFVFGGDANCNLPTWRTAFTEMPEFKLSFNVPQMVWGQRKKTGDLLVACGVHGFDMIEEMCDVPNRCPEHDSMMFVWCYRAQPSDQRIPLPARVHPVPKNNVYRCLPARCPAEKTTCTVEDIIDQVDEKHFQADQESDVQSVESASNHDENDAQTSAPPDKDSDTEDSNTHKDEEHYEELNALGLALAKTASLLPTFSTAIGSRDSLDAAALKSMQGACTEKDRQALEEAVQMFFCKKKNESAIQHGGKQRTRPTCDTPKSAWCFKSPDEINDAWQTMFRKRRLQEPNDNAPINNSNARKEMYNRWMKEFIANELTAEQRKNKRSSQTRIFRAHLMQKYGGKYFIMALWQTGITWAPPKELLDNKKTQGGTEHVVKFFASWVRRVARGVRNHQNDEKTITAKRQSGNTWGQHGLTPEEETLRECRSRARENYYWAVRMDRRLDTPKRKAAKSSNSNDTLTREVDPIAWEDLSGADQWWMHEFWKGNLQRQKEKAESKYRGDQANDFHLDENE